jgi:DNA processing protein
MSAHARAGEAQRDGRGEGACGACRRRSWLLSALGGPLEYCARDRSRLLALLELGDEELLRALAGRRREELRDAYERFPVRGRCERIPLPAREQRRGGRAGDADAGAPRFADVCRHDRRFPHALAGAWAPPMLEVAGGVARLHALARAPCVALLGSVRASDYGMTVARGLARGLAASGVTVVAALRDGVAAAAHAGALEAGGGSVAVLGGGLSVGCAARWRPLCERVLERGCAVSELPRDCDGRRWGALAGERIVCGLAAVAVLVEADESDGELFAARVANARGCVLAAVPGRVSSPLSRGTNALLADGAPLVRGAHDVLELLGGRAAVSPAAGETPAETEATETTERTGTAGARAAHVRLAAPLRRTLALVASGCDTPEELARAGVEPAQALLALSELEVRGLLVRGDAGRYLPAEPLAGGQATADAGCVR